MNKIAIVMPEGLTEEEQEAYRKQMEPIIQALEGVGVDEIHQDELQALADLDADLFDETNDEPELAPYFSQARLIQRTIWDEGDPSTLH